MNSIISQYKTIRAASVQMCKPLETEDYVVQPADFVCPPKWNLALTTMFFEFFVLKKFQKDYRPYHPGFDYIFNNYQNRNAYSFVCPEMANLSRPTVNEVYEYRNYIDKAVIKLLKSKTIPDELLYIIEYGLNQEQKYQEQFFCDIKYVFAINPLHPFYGKKVYVEDVEVVEPEWLQIEGGIYNIGCSGDNFCFNNEKGKHKVYIQNFEIRNGLVSNAEYLDFILAGGYKRTEFWHRDGWKWVTDNRVAHPIYWIQKDNKWYQYTLAGVRPLNPLNPVSHITYFEASAFAAWKGLRLPTEFEWEIASNKLEFGHRWEWTESAHRPYPGNINKADFSFDHTDYSVNQKVLRGGSVLSPKNHTRKTYRNNFPPNAGWQFNGIRLAK